MEGIDRRTALKAANRHAIIRAAAEIVGERGVAGLTVDELATRADVSRRTIFNHFASLDEILPAGFAEALGVVVDEFAAVVRSTPAGQGTAATMFDEIARVLRSADLVTPVSQLMRTVGPACRADPHQDAWVTEALRDTSSRLVSQMLRHHPGADPVDVDLLVGSLVGGLGVVAQHWHERTGAADDPASRAVWDELVDRLLTTLRNGYAARA